MKIRQGFVSNSSSSSFLIAFHHEDVFDIYGFIERYWNKTLPEELYFYDMYDCGRSGDLTDVVYKVDNKIAQFIVDHQNDFLQTPENFLFYPTIQALTGCAIDGYFTLKGIEGDFDIKHFEKDYCTEGIEDFEKQYSSDYWEN